MGRGHGSIWEGQLMDPTVIEQWYSAIMTALVIGVACVLVVLAVILRPRPRNRRRHRLGRSLVASGQLKQVG